MERLKFVKATIFQADNPSSHKIIYVPTEAIASLGKPLEGGYFNVNFRKDYNFGVNFVIGSINFRLSETAVDILQ